MRDFTELEKILLIRIQNGQGSNLYSLIDPWIQGVSFQVNTTENSIYFIFEKAPGLNLIERKEEIQSIVIQSVNLIKLFEEKGYIFTFVNANQLPSNPFNFGQAAVNVPSIPYHFPDPRISKMFCEYSVMEIFITPELNRFITDGFITRQEVRANKQYNTTRKTLIVAIVALALSIVFNIFNIIEKPKTEHKDYTNTSNHDNKNVASYALPDTSVINDTITVIKTTTTITNIKTDTIENER
ncbi:MAG: hypothetical protein U5L09_10415 [Bacteroidales bacterium]|nr:hypothetical protein [Bacteroidales bacterium]